LATCQLLPDLSLSHQLHLSPNKVKASRRRFLVYLHLRLDVFWTFNSLLKRLNLSHYQKNRDLIEELPPCQQ
jgi:hypothetical protein